MSLFSLSAKPNTICADPWDKKFFLCPLVEERGSPSSGQPKSRERPCKLGHTIAPMQDPPRLSCRQCLYHPLPTLGPDRPFGQTGNLHIQRLLSCAPDSPGHSVAMGHDAVFKSNIDVPSYSPSAEWFLLTSSSGCFRFISPFNTVLNSHTWESSKILFRCVGFITSSMATALCGKWAQIPGRRCPPVGRGEQMRWRQGGEALSSFLDFWVHGHKKFITVLTVGI